jgi:hypothetical protein
MSSGFKTNVYKFWTKYSPDPNDPAKLVGHDYVEFGPPGMGERQRGVEKVSRIAAVRPRDPNGMNKTLGEANDLWDCIRPLYEAWKSGQDLPDVGTPLAAWNALTPEQAEVLKMRDVRTVEDIAEMTDAGLSRIPLPGFRKTVEAAKLFLAAQDQTRVAGDLAKKDAEIAALRAEMDEFREALKANDKTGEMEPLSDEEFLPASMVLVPKKRGRPPKQKAA